MKIETKFAIGDEAFFLDKESGEIRSITIEKISISISPEGPCQQTEIREHYIGNNGRSYENIYSSPEELTNSLLAEYRKRS